MCCYSKTPTLVESALFPLTKFGLQGTVSSAHKLRIQNKLIWRKFRILKSLNKTRKRKHSQNFGGRTKVWQTDRMHELVMSQGVGEAGLVNCQVSPKTTQLLEITLRFWLKPVRMHGRSHQQHAAKSDWCCWWWLVPPAGRKISMNSYKHLLPMDLLKL